MEENRNYTVIPIDEKTWCIDQGFVHVYLLAGEEKALLLDSGDKVENIREVAEELAGMPVELLNTHCDMDHCKNNHAFDRVYMHPAEGANYHNSNPGFGNYLPVEDRQVIDLGKRELEVILTPGHTTGSVCILDRRNRYLFAGDTCREGRMTLHGIFRDIYSYRYSLERLLKRKEEFDRIYVCHDRYELNSDYLDVLYKATLSILNGEVPAEPGKAYGIKDVLNYTAEGILFQLDVDKKF